MEIAVSRHTSKALTWALRHGILELQKRHPHLDLSLRKDGYVKLDALLQALGKKAGKTPPTFTAIECMVAADSKGRFSLLVENKQPYLRANQGHSEVVGAYLDPAAMLTPLLAPLPVCLHGTYKKFLPSIKKEGLLKMDREHIHMTDMVPKDRKDRRGIRGSVDVLLFINMEKALRAGIPFYRSSNGVILSPGPLDWEYVSEVRYR